MSITDNHGTTWHPYIIIWILVPLGVLAYRFCKGSGCTHPARFHSSCLRSQTDRRTDSRPSGTDRFRRARRDRHGNWWPWTDSDGRWNQAGTDTGSLAPCPENMGGLCYIPVWGLLYSVRIPNALVFDYIADQSEIGIKNPTIVYRNYSITNCG